MVAFVKYLIENRTEGYNVFNYVDKPDFSMNELIPLVSRVLDRKIPMVHFPYWLGMAGGYCFDVLAFILHKKLSVSSIRVKKFCSTTQFASVKAHEHFEAPYSLADGLSRTLEYEFLHPAQDDLVFYSE